MRIKLLLPTLLVFSLAFFISTVHAGSPATSAASAAAVTPAPQGPNQNFVTCESNNGKRRYCTIGDPRQSVEMVRQISSSPCVRGQSWGNDNRGVWVDRGCRAQFRVITYGGGPTWWNTEGGRPGKRPRDGACFFTSQNFSGDYFCQDRGSSLNVPNGFNDKISSIQVYGRVTITIYNDADFRGFSAATRQSIPDLRAWQVQGYNNKDWNNRITSIRLN
ncbi:MAG TPA: DUF3011 domain-containing protein [Candidatus Acidoferrales bacterium]